MSGPGVPVLRGEQVTLRPAGPGDAERLAEILAHPAVAQWWPGFDLERVRRELTGGDDDTVAFAVEADTSAAPTAPGTTAC